MTITARRAVLLAAGEDRGWAAAGKTQAQVAKEANIGERLYQDYEYNKRTPSVTTAIRIARVLGSTVEELFGAATPAIGETPGGNRANQKDLRD